MSVISRGIGVGPFASSGIASKSRMFNHNHRCFTTDWTGEGREDGEEKEEEESMESKEKEMEMEMERGQCRNEYEYEYENENENLAHPTMEGSKSINTCT